MSNFNVSDYMQSPLDVEQKRQRNEMLGYQNMLAKQAMEDEQQQRAGYQAAYQNMLAQQVLQQQPQETVQPTDALAKLGYGDFQYQPEPQPQQQMPYQPPQGASYGHIKGAEQANALFQKQQVDYYSQNVAPLMEFFIKSGDNESFQKLITQVSESTNPVAGMAKQFATMVQGVNITNPGKLDNVKMTEELRPVLMGMAEETPALKAWIASVPIGQSLSVNVSQGKITGGAEAKPYGWSDDRLELERDKLGLRKKQLEKQREELGLKYDPEVQGAVAESKEASKDLGGLYVKSLAEIPKLNKKLAGLDRLEYLADKNPAAFGKFTKYKTQIASLVNPAAIEALEGDVKARREMEVQVGKLIDNDLKKMFGPPFSDNDLKIMFQMTSADLNSPAGLKEALASARGLLQDELATQKAYGQYRRPTTVPRTQPSTAKKESKLPTEYQVGDSYKGKKIVRLGWFGKSRVALLEGGKQVEIK